MKHKNVFKIAVDCDDVLLPCTGLALELMQEKYKFDPPLSLDEVTGWAPSGNRTDCILECFDDPEFFKMQKPFPGAQEFIRELCKKGTVCSLTAVEPEIMGIRAMSIINYFPEIDRHNIILTSSKDLVDVDVLLDDGAHNILSSKAKFPVLMRRPWNQHISGVLAVNNYNEFLHLIDIIKGRYNEKPIDKDKPKIIALVGPSGSGKTMIAQNLLQTNQFEKPKSYTTRPRRDNETEDAYYFIDPNKFNELKSSGEIFESTMYSGCAYGSSKQEVEQIIKSGKNVVIPIDMCGAMGLKAAFDNVVTIYVNRNKKLLLQALLERNVSNEDKINRMISMDAEERNSELCDYIVNNNADINSVINDILSIIN